MSFQFGCLMVAGCAAFVSGWNQSDRSSETVSKEEEPPSLTPSWPGFEFLAIQLSCVPCAYRPGARVCGQLELKPLSESVKVRHLQLALTRKWLEFDSVRDYDHYEVGRSYDEVSVETFEIAGESWIQGFELHYPLEDLEAIRTAHWTIDVYAEANQRVLLRSFPIG